MYIKVFSDDLVKSGRRIVLSFLDNEAFHDISFDSLWLIRVGSEEDVDLSEKIPKGITKSIDGISKMIYSFESMYYFGSRKLLSDYFKISFTFRDKEDRLYRCIGYKDVSDDKDYLIGEWNLEYEEIKQGA